MSREYDENSALGQSDAAVPPAPHAANAQGVSGAEPPPEKEPLRLGHRDESAAGFTSIYETARHGFGEMGVGRTFTTLLKLNQKDGFDCPSSLGPIPTASAKWRSSARTAPKPSPAKPRASVSRPSFSQRTR